ncbi:MAG: radical SAM protein [bacterium]|nr:radical SAM protein [bacterium]
MFQFIIKKLDRLREKYFREKNTGNSIKYPRILVWENTNKCNLNCIICYRIGRNVDFVDFDNDYFHDKFPEILRHIHRLELSVSGEPFLYGKPGDLQKIFKNTPVKLSAYTNGTTLTNEIIEFITDSFEEIHISFDGFREETYNKIRTGAEFKDVKQKILNLAEMKKKKKSALRIVVDFVIMNMNANDFLPMLKEFSNAGIKDFEASHLILFNSGELEKESLLNNPKEFNQWREEILKFKKELNINILLPNAISERTEEKQQSSDSSRQEQHQFKNCPYLWYKTWVDIKGDVLSCCHPEPIKMGNLAFETLEEIWNGFFYRELRNGFKTGKLPWQCRNCNLIDHKFNGFKNMNTLLKEKEVFNERRKKILGSLFNEIKLDFKDNELIIENEINPMNKNILVVFNLNLRETGENLAYWQIPVRFTEQAVKITVKGEFPDLQFFNEGKKISPVIKKLRKKDLSGISYNIVIDIKDWQTEELVIRQP